MRIEADVKLDFKDVLIRPKRSTISSRSEVSLDRTYQFRHSKRQWTGVPIIASNMDTVGTLAVATVLAQEKLMTCVHKQVPIEEWQNFKKTCDPGVWEYIFVSAGILSADLETLNKILDLIPCYNICLDVANGYSELFVSTVRKLREQYPNYTIMAGNVVTGEMTEELILSGADIVKVGIGPGSVCTTRKITGVGYPQLSALIECADSAHGLGGHIAGDGGCVVVGDVSKAFGAGSDFVMLGGMFSGHDECSGDVIEVDSKMYKLFYGMSSEYAMKKYKGVADYRASEGKVVATPYKGPIRDTIKQILGGLRSTCTYVGASSLKELSKRTTFLRVTQQLNESFSSSASDMADKVKQIASVHAAGPTCN